MENPTLAIPISDAQKLVSLCSGDAALLYLYLHSGGNYPAAQEALHLPQARCACALAQLRQAGLVRDIPQSTPVPLAERPSYSERDVEQAMHADNAFRTLYGEVQSQLGKALNIEELKILLGFNRYLGLPAEVITLLICYCKERARQRGSLRTPSLRTIEKEAYLWHDQGITTYEEAAAYVAQQSQRNSRIGHLAEILQIHGRRLTEAESRYAGQWLDMGFDDGALKAAYERTCLNTGGLSWAYMNKILLRWHENGLHTAAQLQAGDRSAANAPRTLDSDEQAAIRRMMQEE